MPFFVYVLQNPDGRFYIGQTSNLASRLNRHNEGIVTWTKSRGPWELIHSEPLETRSAAVVLERRLKRLKNRRALMEYVAHSVESRQSRD